MWVSRTASDVRVVTHYLGVLIVVIGAVMCLPLITALVLAEWAPALDYVCGVGIAFAIGAWLMTAAPSGTRLGTGNAMLVTALAWLAAALVAAIPLALSGNYGSYLDAFFDSMSGLTTSGLTLVQDLDHMANSHNMWRHLTHLLGGQGIIVAALSFALAKGGGAVSLYSAEGRDEKILPNVMHTARFIWFVTAVYVAVGTLALSALNLVLGMDVIRGTLHAFWATIACYDTGGFGPQSQNALYYHSAWFEGVTVILMLAGTLNFSLHADIWRGDRGEVFRNTEARTLATNIAILSVVVGIGLAATSAFTGGWEIVRKGVYHVLSANTGTGHQSIYPLQWGRDYGGLGFAAVVLAMAFGGMMSSTAGGIKSLRVSLIIKGVTLRVRESLAPSTAALRAKYHHMVDQILTPQVLSSALMISVLYVVTYVSGALVGTALGYGAGESLFESVSAAANVGLSAGITSPTMPWLLKIVYIVQMWAGRLEFIALFALVASVALAFRRRSAR
jgi:trk system potassium uptake protein TrkH